MSVFSNLRGASSSRRLKTRLGARTKRTRQQFALEPLESRVVLSYTFSYSAPVAMAVGSTTGAVDSLVLEPLGGFLLYSVNGAPFSGNWSGNTVPLSPTLQVDVQLSNGDGSSLTLGTPSGPASTFGSGTLSVVAPANTADTMLIDDSNGTTLASSIQPYSIDTVPGTVSGPGFNYDQNGSRNFGGGVTLEGSPVNGDLYNVLSVNVLGLVAFEPFTIITGSSGNSTVNVGSGGTLTISSPLSIYSAGGTATVNINDQNDTTSSTATLDDLSSNPNARFEVTGLSAKPIEYGAGVTALNIFGGTDGDSGVTYNFTSTSTNTTLNDGPNADTVNITGTGVAAGTPLTINDDTNTTVFYDAGGGTPVVAPGILGDSVVITLPGSGTVDANGIAQLNITNLSPIPIIPGPAQTINTVEGFNLFDAIATFQSPLATILPTVPGGPPVIDFAATIDWGDPSPDLSPGIITQGPSNPSVYHVVGAHTFVDEGTYSVANTVDFAGGPVSEVLNGVTVNITLSPSGPTTGNAATANVTDARLTGSAGTDITGVEGISTGTVLLGTFVDANQAATVADYTLGGGSVVVNWGDGSAPQTLAASNLAAIGAPGSVVWTINAAHTYTEEGTYSYTVTVTDDGGASTVVAGSAIIADAALAPSNPQPTVSATEGANTGSVPVATFTDGNPTATVADFTATIDWGDGSPTSLGSVTEAAGVFTVSGAHTYSEESTNLVPPTYPIVVNIVDVGGSRLTTTTTASVADAPLAPSNPQPTVNAIERINTGLVPVATFTDANPTATIADFTATIDWGDGSPPSLGLVTEGATGVFTVSGGHTYMEESTNLVPPTFTITVNIVDDGGSRLTTTTTASVVSPFVVTNTRDSGLGSLRFAIQVANADLNHDDTITFQIPASDPHYNPATGSWTIPVGAGLTIAKPSSEGGQHSVVIAGLSQQSQPGASITHPVIEITPAAGFVGDGLTLNSDGNTVQGLVIDGFQGAGLVLNSSTDNNLIVGNFVGTDPTGTVGRGNTFDGIRLNDASNNRIIGNVVSDNGINQDAAGINLESNDRNNIIAGNEIGTNAVGDAMLGNSLHGIFLGNGSSNNTIGDNVIFGNGKFPVANLSTQGGVEVYIFGADTSGNVVQGNKIGTNAAGIAALDNSVIGVLINQSRGNTVQGNVISGNRHMGIEIAGGTASGNLVQNNSIGTNGSDGIFINDAPNNTIGGTAAGAGNRVSGNGFVGIQLFGQLTKNNVIQGNIISDNRLGGILVNTSANNTIGGTGPGQANEGQSIPIFEPLGLTDPGTTSSVAARRRSRRGKATPTRTRAVVPSHPSGPSAHIPHHWSPSGGNKRSPHRV